MELITLGTGTVAPSAARTGPAHWVTTGDVRILLDCGPGASHRAESFNVPWATVTHIAITHFHPDHWSELPLFLYALRWGTLPARTDPLTLFGPTGITERLAHLAKAYGDWVLNPGFPLEIQEVEPGDTFELAEGILLQACKTRHTDESLAYGIRDRSHRLVFTGDTGHSDELAQWAHGCDLLLMECSLPDDQGIEIHMTPGLAAEFARMAEVDQVVLTHFYPSVINENLVDIVSASFSGPVTVARDGERFTL